MLCVAGDRVLVDGGPLRPATLHIQEGRISKVGDFLDRYPRADGEPEDDVLVFGDDKAAKDAVIALAAAAHVQRELIAWEPLPAVMGIDAARALLEVVARGAAQRTPLTSPLWVVVDRAQHGRQLLRADHQKCDHADDDELAPRDIEHGLSNYSGRRVLSRAPLKTDRADAAGRRSDRRARSRGGRSAGAPG